MTRVQRWLVPVVALVVGMALTAAQAQAPEGGRRGGMGRGGSVLGLLRMEQVQKELKLNEDQLAKVKKVDEELTAEMTKESAPLRDIQDRDERRAKTAELTAKFDAKACEQLGGTLSKEQMTRLSEVRIQVRGAVDSLASKEIADKLKLTDEQKAKLAEISKDTRAKQTELFTGLRDATEEQRTEGMAKLRKLRAEADEKAVGVLNAEQKKSFEEMKGKEFKLEMQPRPAA